MLIDKRNILASPSLSQELKEQYETLLQNLDTVAETDVHKLTHQQLGAEWSFDPATSAMTNIIWMAAQVRDTYLNWLPHERIQPLIDVFYSARVTLSQVAEFKIKENGSVRERKDLLEAIQRIWNEVLEACTPVMLLKQIAEPKSGDRIETALASARKSAAEVQNLLEETRLAVNAIRELSPAAGVATQASRFDNLARQYERRATVWLAVSVLLGVALLLVTFEAYTSVVVTSPMPEATPAVADAAFERIAVAKWLGSRAITISVISGFLIFAGRNYSTSRHNYVLNKHRATALETFQTFVSGTANAETKDAILLQAAKAAFGVQSTGYLRKDGGPNTGGPLVEILGKFTGTGS